jgi:hypothetical protein
MISDSDELAQPNAVSAVDTSEPESNDAQSENLLGSEIVLENPHDPSLPEPERPGPSFSYTSVLFFRL